MPAITTRATITAPGPAKPILIHFRALGDTPIPFTRPRSREAVQQQRYCKALLIHTPQCKRVDIADDSH
jgi:hypothetical protein